MLQQADLGRLGSKEPNRGLYTPREREREREGGFTEGKKEEHCPGELPQ